MCGSEEKIPHGETVSGASRYKRLSLGPGCLQKAGSLSSAPSGYRPGGCKTFTSPTDTNLAHFTGGVNSKQKDPQGA